MADEQINQTEARWLYRSIQKWVTLSDGVSRELCGEPVVITRCSGSLGRGVARLSWCLGNIVPWTWYARYWGPVYYHGTARGALRWLQARM